jgi:hypothetical protein
VYHLPVWLAKLCVSSLSCVQLRSMNSVGQPSPLRVSQSYRPYVAWSGRIGFVCKALIYIMIGVLTLISLVNLDPIDESPQGVFIFIGSTPNHVGDILLLIVLIGIFFYVHWRFVEAFVGQGETDQLRARQNFFRYRLSPFVSGIVYSLYSVFIIQTLIETWSSSQDSQPSDNVNESCFPKCWYFTTLGRVGLFLLALCFYIACITQLEHVILGTFMTELQQSVRNRTRKFVYIVMETTGRFGFLGRAILFLLVAVVFTLVFAGDDDFVQDQRFHTIAQALNHWMTKTIGKVALWIMGICLLIYGVFALLCVKYRNFPTRVRID